MKTARAFLAMYWPALLPLGFCLSFVGYLAFEMKRVEFDRANNEVVRRCQEIAQGNGVDATPCGLTSHQREEAEALDRRTKRAAQVEADAQKLLKGEDAL